MSKYKNSYFLRFANGCTLPIALCAGLGWLSGCATIIDKDQVVLVKSEPPGAAVFYKGKNEGETPVLVKVKSAHHDEILVRLGESKKAIELNGDYRWGRSFFGNLMYLSLAPIGWVTDFVSGHAWQFHPDYAVQFANSAGVRPPSKAISQRKTLAIAPPLFAHANLSDEVGAHLEEKLRNDFPNYEILPFGQTVEKFDTQGFDFESQDLSANRNRIFFEAKVDKIFFFAD